MASRPKYTFDVAQPLTVELCEFVGALLGDGNIYQHPRTVKISITGHKDLDKEYHEHLALLAKKLFNISASVRVSKDRVCTAIYSKVVFKFLSEKFDIKTGPKTFTANIPDAILCCGDEFRAAALRGLFDTDGGIGFDRRGIYKKPYVRINYVSSSFDLIQSISIILNGFQIRHSIHLRDYGNPQLQIQINGEKQASKFIEKIGFSNPRHLNKLPKNI